MCRLYVYITYICKNLLLKGVIKMLALAVNLLNVFPESDQSAY